MGYVITGLRTKFGLTYVGAIKCLGTFNCPMTLLTFLLQSRKCQIPFVCCVETSDHRHIIQFRLEHGPGRLDNQ